MPSADRTRSALFICIEGVDCTGKTSVSHALCASIGAQYFHGPGEPLKSAISALPPMTDRVLEYFLHRAAIQNDSKIIRQMLQNGHVVADRYIFSTRAYFGASEPKLIKIADAINVVMPDSTYLLIADVAIRRRRLSERPSSNARETDETFQEKAAALFKKQRHVSIDTTHRDAASTAHLIRNHLMRRYRHRL